VPNIVGGYDGEGLNVTGTKKVTALDLDVGASTVASGANGGQGASAMVKVTRRRQLRVSSESAQAGVAISYGGGDQVLSNCARGVYITTGGTLVIRMKEDTADLTFTGLIAGQYYPLAIALIRNSGSTAAGILLY